MRRFVAVVALLSVAFALPACSDDHTSSQAMGAASAHAALALAGRVMDAAQILDAEQQANLSAKLEALERVTGYQMVVVTVPTLGGEDIATFTRDLGNRWGIGREGEDDGVLLLIAPNERLARIEVGYGLERTLTDAVAEQILQDEIIPHFRQNDLPGGIDAGVDALISRLQ